MWGLKRHGYCCGMGSCRIRTLLSLLAHRVPIHRAVVLIMQELLSAAAYGNASASRSSLATLTGWKMTQEGEAWPTYTDRETEMVGRGGEKELQARRQAPKREYGSKKEGKKSRWLREGKQEPEIGRERMLSVSRSVVKGCYIMICLSRLDVKLGYWWKNMHYSHKENVHRNRQNKALTLPLQRTQSEDVRTETFICIGI